MEILDYIKTQKDHDENFNQKAFAEQLGPDQQSYISYIARFKAVPSLMMSLVIEILSDGQIQPKDLVTRDQLEKYLTKKNIHLAQKKFDQYKPK